MECLGMYLASSKWRAHIARNSLPASHAAAVAAVEANMAEGRVGIDTRDLHCRVGHDGARSEAIGDLK
jgi:hypothetical protein